MGLEPHQPGTSTGGWGLGRAPSRGEPSQGQTRGKPEALPDPGREEEEGNLQSQLALLDSRYLLVYSLAEKPNKPGHPPNLWWNFSPERVSSWPEDTQQGAWTGCVPAAPLLWTSVSPDL